jgi:putative PEP-CTERM system TPR-repeat lipoprotein
MRPFSQQPITAPNRLLFALILGISLTACGVETSEALVGKARQSLEAGDHKAAIIQLKSAIQKDERNAEARFQLGRLYLDEEQYEAAEKEFQRAREAGFAADQLTPYLARALNGQREFKRLLEEIPQPAPGSSTEADVLVARATAQTSLGQKEEAGRSLERARAVAPKRADVYLAQARLALTERNLDATFLAIDSALNQDPKHRDSWLFKGDLLRATGKPAEAAKAYQAALKIDPKHAGVRLAIAGIAIGENRLADARKEVDTVLKASPNNLQARYTQALIDFREKKLEAARDHLADVLKFAPEYLPALLLGGSIEFALGNLQTAETHLNKVVRAAPHSLDALRLLAATQLRLGRPDDAEKTLAPINLDKVEDTGVLAAAGEIALAKKEFTKAAAYFDKAAELSPDNAAIRTQLGMARLAQGDSRAMADLQTAAGMEGADERVDSIIILNQLRQKQFDGALKSIAAFEKKQPQSPLPWNYRGAAYIGKKDAARARSSFNQALKLDPKFFPAAANLAQLDLVDGKTADARKRFEGILKADPAHLQAMLAMADLSQRDKDEKAYVSWLEKAIKAHPKALPPREGLTRHLLAKGEKAKALAIAREAVAANPDNPSALNLLGSTQLATGDNTNAISTFTLLTRKANQSPDAYLRLALALLEDKKLAEARASLQTALRLKPDHPQSQDALLRLELLEKKPDAALRIARQIQTRHPKSALGFDREADIQLSQKRLPEAIKAYEQALERGAGSAGMIKLFRAEVISRSTKRAEQRINDWLKQHPKDNAVRAHAAEYYLANGRNQEAIAQYTEIQRLTPGNPVVLNNLANLYQLENDKRALATAEQALKASPDSPAIQDTLGWILVEQGQAQRGLELLRKAVAKAPDSAALRYHHAVALARTGNKAEARKAFEKLLKDSPDFAEAEAARAELKSL